MACIASRNENTRPESGASALYHASSRTPISYKPATHYYPHQVTALFNKTYESKAQSTKSLAPATGNPALVPMTRRASPNEAIMPLQLQKHNPPTQPRLGGLGMALRSAAQRVTAHPSSARPSASITAFWVFASKPARNIAAALFADEMGLGKTATSPAVTVVGHRLRDAPLPRASPASSKKLGLQCQAQAQARPVRYILLLPNTSALKGIDSTFAITGDHRKPPTMVQFAVQPARIIVDEAHCIKGKATML
ncbi:hypothetical protein B0T14DRAFT_493282 [Immersiella caudata]|uniref:Uncharacterized protein n=1 Tax=Immersiella caudata TaxID=314043 RepID=A0AA40C6M3_9PEZI|nr:hypothetical protein B0T14DRAFT_493282 [Immersiella caudata]